MGVRIKPDRIPPTVRRIKPKKAQVTTAKKGKVGLAANPKLKIGNSAVHYKEFPVTQIAKKKSVKSKAKTKGGAMPKSMWYNSGTKKVTTIY